MEQKTYNYDGKGNLIGIGYVERADIEKVFPVKLVAAGFTDIFRFSIKAKSLGEAVREAVRCADGMIGGQDWMVV